VSRLIRAVIETRALRHNLNTIRERARRARVMAVVKANAYGHGLVPTALSLAEADAFAVARLEEGLALRAAGITQPIVLLEGVFSAEQLLEAARHGFDLLVHDALQVELLEEMSGAHRFVLWIKIDTGMNRLGFPPHEFHGALERVRRLRHAPLEIRLLTHLACADERDGRMTGEQLARFREATRALYGASPFADSTAAELGLTPVMSLESSVLAVRRVSAGETVGYGAAWKAPRDSRIAIIAAGYGDGLPRNLPGGTPVLVAGERAPLVGRVSMDMIAADVTALAEVHVGTPAVLWGAGLPVEEIARHAGTIPYELLCSVSQRVPLELR
jgi:alanine racemase